MEQQLRIKKYDPDGSSYAPRIRNEQWEQYKPLLRHLHDTSLKRADMLDVLKKQGFNPSLGQLNNKMTMWGFKVYGTQPDSSDRDSATPTQHFNVESADTEMAEMSIHEVTTTPTLRGSTSSITLVDPPAGFSMQHTGSNLTLDQAIFQHCFSAANPFYWPSTKPLDFGIKPVGGEIGVDEAYCSLVVSVADFLCAVHYFEKAFDLYYHVFEHMVTRGGAANTSFARPLVQCAMSAITDAQCDYVLSFLNLAQQHSIENMSTELASCFGSLATDLCNKNMKGNEDLASSQMYNRSSDIPLLIAADPTSNPNGLRREWYQQQLLKCDNTCSTLAHLSSWCQDTLSFHGIESRAMVRFSPKTDHVEAYKMTAFETDFQRLAQSLIIDFLNNPGPSMRMANVDCKDENCAFRRMMTPSTSLIVMAHLLYEPLRLQTQNTNNEYLAMRAGNLARSQWTTALLELQAFAAADSNTRCEAFVDTYIKHFNTTLAFRRFASNVECEWDRMWAAKRLVQITQNSMNGVLPHAGLPSGRRSVLKEMVDFPHDPSLTEGRPSTTSDSGSMREFQRFATRINNPNTAKGSLTPSEAMSIDSHSSWSFQNVTGLAAGGPMSGRNSISSRLNDLDEMDEDYRQPTKGGSYTHQSQSSQQSTPTQRNLTPVRRKPRQ